MQRKGGKMQSFTSEQIRNLAYQKNIQLVEQSSTSLVRQSELLLMLETDPTKEIFTKLEAEKQLSA